MSRAPAIRRSAEPAARPVPPGSSRGRRPSPPPRRGSWPRAADHRLERVDVAHLVAQDHDAARPVARRPAARPPRACRRPRAAAGPRLNGRGSGRGRGPGHRGARPPRSRRPRRRVPPATSSACRTWNATDGPLRSTNSQAGCPSSSATPDGEDLRRVAVVVVCRVRRHHEPLRPPAARQRPVLSPWSPRYSIPPTRTRAATSATTRPVRTATCTPARPRCPTRASAAQARRASGSMPGDGRVARADRERPIEVGDDQERRAAGGERASKGRGGPRRRRTSARRRPAGRRSRRDVDTGHDRLEAAGHDVRARSRRGRRRG